MNEFIQGSEIDCTLGGAPVVDAGTQYVCVGWVGTGSMPAAGQTTATGPLTITNDSTLAWAWATNYWLSVVSEPGGGVDAVSAWYAKGTNATLTAAAKPYVTFDGWSGDTAANDTNSVTLALTMDGSLAVTAHFTQELATNNTPLWWLAEHYGTNGNFNQLALSDTDGDGLQAWQEYRAGTLPTNSLSRLAILWQQILSNGTPVMYWDTVTDRSYSVYAATNMPPSQWLHLGRIPGTGSRVSYVTTNQWGRPVYYRVTVQPD